MHAQGMFESSMYSQLLSIIDSAIREAKITQNNFEAEFVSVLIFESEIVAQAFFLI